MVKVEMVILSHLADAQHDLHSNPRLAAKRIQFVRTLIFDYPNTTVTISDEELNQIWNAIPE
jgi:hypothetical protein